MTKKKNFNLAIVGLGNIGLNLYKHLIKNKKSIIEKNNVFFDIKYVSAKNKKKKRGISIPKKKWLRNYLDASKLDDIDIVIELIGGADGPAKKLVFDSIRRKKHVVTANKSLISKHGDQLALLAERNKVNIEFEAAVAGGIPIIRTLKEGFVANKTKKIYGILNGTSNFILSSMDKMNISFNKALNKAKKLGYAESNPKSDLNGDDVRSKVQILSSLAFNCFINKNNINQEGINFIDETDIKNANILGYKIKHIGFSEISEGKLIQRVNPCLIKKGSRLGNVNGVLNAVIIEGEPIGKSVLQGEGAGAGPTTSALVSDICSILRGNLKYPFSVSHKKRKKINSIDISNQLFSNYIRLDAVDKKGVLSAITKIMSKNKISVKRLIQDPLKGKKYASIIIISHKAKNKNVKKCIDELNKKNFIINRPKFIRIEEI